MDSEPSFTDDRRAARAGAGDIDRGIDTAPVSYQRVQLNTRALWADVEAKRLRLGLSLRRLGEIVGYGSPSTLGRLANGHPLSAKNLANLLVWLGDSDLGPYLSPQTSQDHDPGETPGEHPPRP